MENSQEINGQKEAADEEPEYDEHIWLSFVILEIMVKNIEKAIEQLDSDNAKSLSKQCRELYYWIH